MHSWIDAIAGVSVRGRSTSEPVSYFITQFQHRGPTQCVCVADCYYIVNALDLPFASPIAIYR